METYDEFKNAIALRYREIIDTKGEIISLLEQAKEALSDEEFARLELELAELKTAS